MNWWISTVLLCCAISGMHTHQSRKEPKILIVTLIRNKAHTLPLFFTYLTQLDYPKDRIALWIRSDHNADASLEIVGEWLKEMRSKYHSVHYTFNASDPLRREELSPTHWPLERFKDVIAMKEEALRLAREIWADYVFFLDADAFLTNPSTLRNLVSIGAPIVAPMLTSDGLYSNYWCGMSEDFYYERTEEYKKILNRENVGVFSVPMVHSAVLVDLNHPESDLLTFDKDVLNFHLESLNSQHTYNGPVDDIIIFAMSANYSGIPMKISNEVAFGYIMVPLEQDEDIRRDQDQMTNIRLMIWNDLERLDVLPNLRKYIKEPKKDRMTLSRIFMVNLKRRPERRWKMEGSFRELGLDVEYFEAVDGREIDEEFLNDWEIDFLPGYADPYHKRPMTMGEVGCFLSHLSIWRRIVNENLQEVLILEDDIRFEPFFRDRFSSLLNEARYRGNWDLIYLGRKRLHESSEPWVEDSNQLVYPSYSYWTLGYLISKQGAKKLLEAHPLAKLVPVDEFLPIMFDKHPNDEWKSAFSPRNLIAMSAAPLQLYPTHYTGEEGYISDTEDSIQIPLNSGEVFDVPRKSDKANQALEMDKVGKPLLDGAINDRWTNKEDHSDL
ncbi:glycosyltransferase 25 family member [Phlebotomus papatasi]|uniref:glycosyltransferase 25 family member n=1 Tax=Phlebotomus papatasi TaxID=29031 RepID=UPI0024834FF2|nr:glycosyltransferase 25 family member [Phlebotomus papatasi]